MTGEPREYTRVPVETFTGDDDVRAPRWFRKFNHERGKNCQGEEVTPLEWFEEFYSHIRGVHSKLYLMY